ncbi:MAG: type IV pilus twitching motility protein PilT, partial [Planctomycetota bacterium]
TGSGKSTTLAAMIGYRNENSHGHIITIEDPIEYVHRPAKALVNQRQVGTDTASFNEALVASLREDPDVVLVGEIRDTDTIRTAITAAETGHLVFTTVHAGDCVSTIERMVGVFPADEQPAIRQQLALVLRCVVAQRLLVADGLAVQAANAREQARQRVVASEVLMVTPAVSNLVLQSKSNQIYSSMEAGGSQGMQTFEQDLARLLVEGQLSERSAVAAAKRPDVLRDRAEQTMRQQPASRLPGNQRNPR